MLLDAQQHIINAPPTSYRASRLYDSILMSHLATVRRCRINVTSELQLLYRQVSAVADGPERRAAARASCCAQRWTLSVINYQWSSVERRPSQVLSPYSSADDGLVYHTELITFVAEFIAFVKLS